MFTLMKKRVKAISPNVDVNVYFKGLNVITNAFTRISTDAKTLMYTQKRLFKLICFNKHRQFMFQILEIGMRTSKACLL